MQEVGENDTAVTEFILIGWSGRPRSRMILIPVYIVSYFLAIAGNGLIVLVVICDSQLHNPMYFFLCNLSFIDLGFTTSTIPQSIANCLVERPVMSSARCFIQMYAILLFGTTECFFLAVMAYDRLIAISRPLHYTFIMSRTVCIFLAAVSWFIAFTLTVVPCLAKPARFCGNNEIDHIGCEFKSMFNLICTDTSLSQISIYFSSILALLLPLGFILFSYMCILQAILRMSSEGGRIKAFSTCGSHLSVVTMYYGVSIFIYILPPNKKMHEIEKTLSVFNSVLTPVFNPLVYTLRNQEVLGALGRIIVKNKLGMQH
ncbi:olfactory receptor 13H1-like [Crotalus tigris]|uniref:olfactory receptor 13H1-like n=1 Tax=Crotalus tigris TaxID=88082 RepID=UPI00192F3CED|nr:olfactory receptor 13H1-like [Crotalus tigris]